MSVDNSTPIANEEAELEHEDDDLGTEGASTEMPDETQEDDDYDRDSAIGDLGSYATSTYTVGSSVARRVEEHGRTYHTYHDGKYMFPNDEIELNRLDIQHKMWLITLDDKLHLAPIGPGPQEVLDIATGTGIWAIDFAEAYPSAKVLGTDLSLSQPEYVPINVQFEIDDAEDDWVFPPKFDYIHGRALVTCFKDFTHIIREAYKSLKPGGYLELQDLRIQQCDDDTIKGTAVEEWGNYVQEATTKAGRPWADVPSYKRWMCENGFVDVVETRFRWPLSPWSHDPKENLLAAWLNVQLEGGAMESGSNRLFRSILGWEEERLSRFLERVKTGYRNTDIHAYHEIFVVYGRKPLGT